MFNKKINKKIEDELNKLDEISKKLDKYHSSNGITLGSMVSIMKKILQENQELKEQVNLLVNMNNGVLGEAISCELFAYKSYRGKPVIYKDGKLISEDQLRDIRITIDGDGTVSVDLDY